MAVALAELSASPLADICVTRPQISTRPLMPSEYYPPGTSRTSKIQTGVDADRIFNATVGQRSYIIQQLEEAERNARDALFALEMVQMELAREAATIRSTLSRVSETLPPHEFENMLEFAFGQSKKDWEDLWKHEWVDDGKERDKFVKRSSGPSRKPRPGPQPSQYTPRVCSSPLPPSSPPPPTPPVNARGRLPPRTSGVPRDEYQRPTRPRSPLPPDGFRAPWGFVDNFGSTGYRPTPPDPVAGPSQQSRRLKRDKRRVDQHRDGTLVLVDPEEAIEVQRRQIKEKMELQAQERLPVGVKNSLWKMVQANVRDRTRDPPVTWSSVFEGEEPRLDELMNPFAQDDRVIQNGVGDVDEQ